MTCIAALVQDGKVYLAGDSFMGWDDRVLPRDRVDAKVFRHASGMLVGTCGRSLAQRRIRAMTMPTRRRGEDASTYVLGTLGPAIAACVGEDKSFEFLIGIDGQLFHGFPDQFTIEVVEGFTAIGSGGPLALGSLATPSDDPPRTRVRRAVTIAERYTATVRGPIVVIAGSAATTVPMLDATSDGESARLSSSWRDLDKGVRALDGRDAA